LLLLQDMYCVVDVFFFYCYHRSASSFYVCSEDENKG
jgi:hypothetical protein